jgi:hypothetical protein
MTELTRTELLDEARAIAESYRTDGYDLTLRQLYYQCVAKALIPNSDESYKRLGDTLGDARLKGDFDMDLLVDRGRDAKPSKHHEAKLDVDVALDEAGRYLKALPHWSIAVDRWFGQPKYVSVWVEKEALAGVFDKPCEDLGVGFFACKGYPSHSALWQWLQKLEEAYQTSQSPVVDDEGNELEVEEIDEAVVLYFGDHDPDGWQIPRSAEETLNTLAQVHGLDIPSIRFVRVALLMSQIKQYKPPPFPAKKTSSRFAGYIQEHGISDAWELDALNPKVLDKLIRDNVVQHWDQRVYDHWQMLAKTNRGRLRTRMKEPNWVPSVLEGA